MKGNDMDKHYITVTVETETELEGHPGRVVTCDECDELLEDCACQECEQCGEELDEDDLVSFAVAGVCTICETGLER